MARTLSAGNTLFYNGTTVPSASGTVMLRFKPAFTQASVEVEPPGTVVTRNLLQGGNTPSAYYLNFFQFGGNQLYAGFHLSGTDHQMAITPVSDHPGLFVMGTWATWVLTWNDATNVTSLYKDAVLVQAKGDTDYSMGAVSFTRIDIGQAATGATSCEGDVSQLARWDRVLTSGEITTLNTFSPPAIPSGLIYYNPIAGDASPEPAVIGTPPLELNGSPPKAADPPVTVTVTPSFIAAATQLFAPTIIAAGAGGEVIILPNFIPSTSQVFAPSVITPMSMGETHFPVSIDEPRNLLIAANNKQAFLAAPVTASDSIITVTGDLSGWPSSGALTLDVLKNATLDSSEICYYEGIAGQTITLFERGVDGTSAKDFATGARVEMRPTARHHNVLAEAIIAIETEVDSKADSVALNSKLSLSGGTLTGPLILAAPPVSAMQAATKAYADLLASGLPPGIFLASDYNAAGIKATTTGSVTAGTGALTVASASGYAIGQGIFIAGAGASGAQLVTTISNIAGSVITLATNAATTVTNALVQHDDSAAINAVMAAAVSAGGGEVWFSPGYYRCNGAFTSADSVLAPPFIPVIDGTPIAITLRGLGPIPWFSFDGPHPQTGVIFQTDKVKATANSSLFACAPYLPGTNWAECSNIVLYFENIIFRTYDNPNINALDLAMVGGCALRHVWIETGVTLLDGAQPANDVFGFRMSRANTPTGFSYVDRVWIMNYYTGAIIAECQGEANILVLRCVKGYILNHNYAPSRAILNTYQCGMVLQVNDVCYLDWTLHIENAPDGFWYSPMAGYHFYDPNNYAHGQVKYSSLRSETGATVPLSNSGAASLVFTNLRT